MSNQSVKQRVIVQKPIEGELVQLRRREKVVEIPTQSSLYAKFKKEKPQLNLLIDNLINARVISMDVKSGSYKGNKAPLSIYWGLYGESTDCRSICYDPSGAYKDVSLMDSPYGLQNTYADDEQATSEWLAEKVLHDVGRQWIYGGSEHKSHVMKLRTKKVLEFSQNGQIYPKTGFLRFITENLLPSLFFKF